MVATATVTRISAAEIDAVIPVVEINSAIYDWTTCLTVEQNVDATPSKALIYIGGGDYELQGPITLNRFAWPFDHRSRVQIKAEGQSIFTGFLVQREDSGAADQIIWTAYDEKLLLSKIPVRGAVVFDPDDGSGTVKYVSRYTPRVNPGGQWNCRGAQTSGGIVPVFATYAEMGRRYDSPDEVFPDNLADGELSAWTPRRFLQYLQFVYNLNPGDIQGAKKPTWRTIGGSAFIKWDKESLSIANFKAEDPAIDGAYDPLDRKIQDRNFQGKTLLGAIVEALKVTGSHGLRLEQFDGFSKIAFFARGLSGLELSDETSDTQRIPLQRDGAALDAHTAYEFTLMEDSRDVSESVLVEGQPIRVEARFAEERGTGEEQIGTLRQAWTIEEENLLWGIVSGDNAEGEFSRRDFCRYPSVQDSFTLDLTADGLSGRPLVQSYSIEAMAFARQLLTRPFRAYYIDSLAAFNDDILKGVDGQFLDQTQFPFIHGTRPIMPAQLQYYTKTQQGEVDDGSDVERLLLQRYPIRIEIQNIDSLKYFDAPFNNGLRVSGDGFLWLTGLAEESDATPWCLYDHTFRFAISAADEVDNLPSPNMIRNNKARLIRANMAVPLDHRVEGYSTVKISQTQLDQDRFNDLGGPWLHYAPTLDSYRDEEQIKSFPTPYQFYRQDDATTGDATTGLTRFLPPGEESKHARFAAERLLLAKRFVKRNSQWSIVGIRPDYRVGQWVERVTMNGTAEKDYDINAPIERLLFDFKNQRTVVGGLLSTVTADVNMSKNEFIGEQNEQAGEAKTTTASRNRQSKPADANNPLLQALAIASGDVQAASKHPTVPAEVTGLGAGLLLEEETERR